MKIFKWFFRWFFIITGYIPYLLYLHPKFIFESEKAKNEYKKNKYGVILVGNHTRIFDYYCILYKFSPRFIHTMVADVVYKIFGLKFLNYIMENIKIKRDGTLNTDAIKQCSHYLRKNKIVLIFPEGKLEDKKGSFEEFYDTASYISLTEQKQIIPIYFNGEYGFFKRPRIMIGEKIVPSDCYNLNDIENESKELTEKIVSKLKVLRAKTKNQKKYKTKTIFTTKYWLMDFVRIFSIPIFYLIFLTKKRYKCNRKIIRRSLKYNSIIIGNHLGFVDPLFMYMHFLTRRMCVIALEKLFDNRFLKFSLTHAGTIKYHRDTMKQIDVIAFKSALDVLDANGVIGIFPEGHINISNKFEEDIKGGAAMLSLLTNSPIIPFAFADEFKPFKKNYVVIGNPIYPEDYVDLNKEINTNVIHNYNKIIYNNLKALYEDANKLKKGKYGKATNLR